MTSLNLHVSLTEFALTPDQTLGGRSDAVASRVSIGQAQPWRVTVDKVAERPDLIEALRTQARSDYYVLAFVCSFLERDGEHIESATFGVQLRSTDGGAAPIAWSLSPVRSYSRPIHVNQGLGIDVGVHLGADLKLTGSTSQNYDKELLYVTAAGERESDPEWEYRRRPNVTLDGPHEMTLVAQVPAGQSAMATCGLSTLIMRPRWGISHAHLRLPTQQAILRFGP